jgi:tRNA uridine 5-carboxymethylaminomethyl modification enzyme
MAGINAHNLVYNKESFVLNRNEAYIGVLIDDLINKGTKEPYRMFTSRAEFRLLLRQDNADIRLTPIGHKLGIASAERMERTQQKMQDIEKILDYVRNESVNPEELSNYLDDLGSAQLQQKVKLDKVVLRPFVGLESLRKEIPRLNDFLNSFKHTTIESAEIDLKYEGYLKKEEELVVKMKKLEKVKLKSDFDYKQITALSAEGMEKLTSIKPKTLGQASRISGVSPSDISILMVYLNK